MAKSEAVHYAHQKAIEVRNDSRRIVESTRQVTRAWRAWLATWEDAAAHRHYGHHLIILICSYCRRFRAPDGTWYRMPDRIDQRVAGPCAKFMSHGLCPDCLAERFGSSAQSREAAD